ncbi:MAG: hypothetical protein WCG23_11840 [bacterium]
MKVNPSLVCKQQNNLKNSNSQVQKNFNETNDSHSEINLNLQPNAHLNKLSFTGSLNKGIESAEVFVGKFLKTESPIESAKLLLGRYPELSWLTGSVNATPEGVAKTSKSISEAIFGKQHTEFDRTLTGIETIKWVLKGDYEQFTKCQKPEVKLTRENFDHLKRYTHEVLPKPEDVDAMIGYTVINDLGKIKSVVSDIQQKTGIHAVDHDDILLYALKHTPEEVPTFKRLSPEHKDTVVRSLEPQFNIGQFLQAENLPANLTGLKNLDPKAMDYYLTHAVYDIAGAAGHVNPDGSVVMTNPLYEGFKQGINSIKRLSNGESEATVYNSFMQAKAEALQMPFDTPKDKALAKLAVLSRAGSTGEAKTIRNVFESLSDEHQKTLTTHLNRTGIEDKGILLYYAPAFLQNLKGALKEQPEQALQKGFSTLAELYQRADKMADKPKGVFTVLISDIAKTAKEAPEKLLPENISLKPVGDNAEAIIA